MKRIIIAALALAGCTDASTAKLDAALARADQSVAHFCTVQQPVIGRLAKVTAAGVAAASPETAAVAPVVGLVVALVDGTCASIGGVDAPKPAQGTPVVVP